MRWIEKCKNNLYPSGWREIGGFIEVLIFKILFGVVFACMHIEHRNIWVFTCIYVHTWKLLLTSLITESPLSRSVNWLGFLWQFLYPSPALESLNRGGSVAKSSAGFKFAVFSERMLPRVQPWISRGTEPRGRGAFSANKSRIGNVLEKRPEKFNPII